VTAAVDVHSLGAVLQELLGDAPGPDAERDELGSIVRELLRAGPSAGFTNVDNFAGALQDAVRRTGTVVARQSISAQVRGICEQYLLERRRQVRNLRDVEWADRRDAPSVPPASGDVESVGDAAPGAAAGEEEAENGLDLGEYQEETGDDAVTRIYDGEELESEGPSQPQAWMHDSGPVEAGRQGWSRWAVVSLLGVLIAVASGAAVMASRSVARAPQASADTRVASVAGAPSLSAAAPVSQKAEAVGHTEGAAQAAPAPVEPEPAAAAAGGAATAALAALGGQATEEVAERGTRAVSGRRGGDKVAPSRPVLRRVAAAPKRSSARAGSAEAGNRVAAISPAAVSEPTTVDVSELPEARDDAQPAAPPPPPVAPAPKAAAKPADSDLVIEEVAPKMAFLSVDADPYATVFIDGEKKGVTPLVRLELLPGLHRMIARTEDGRTKRFTLQLDAGKTEAVKVSWGEGQ
jgi:hypothetical protein